LAHNSKGRRPFSSWPGLSRPSTSLLLQRSQDVDARHKAGHDEIGIGWPRRERRPLACGEDGSRLGGRDDGGEAPAHSSKRRCPFRHGRAKARSASSRRCPGHPRLSCFSEVKTWMPGTRPGMTRLKRPSVIPGWCVSTRPQMCDCTSGNPWIPGSTHSRRPGMTVAPLPLHCSPCHGAS
jgi:hypothetical protein